MRPGTWRPSRRPATWCSPSATDRLRCRKVAPPEVEGAFEVAFGGVAVVDGQVGHGETVGDAGEPLDNPPYTLALQLFAELVGVLPGRRAVGLGKGEVELGAHAGDVAVGGVGLI